jgi:division/cell wall cluster transcriptional repressor MraZ
MALTFSGTSEHGLDDKGRLTLPQRILDQVARADWRFFLTVSMDKCLLLHDAQGWNELVAKIGTGVHGSQAHRNLSRRFLGSAEEVVPDTARRIRIPEPLLEYAGLAPSMPVRLLGMGNVLEVWSPALLGGVLSVPTAAEESLFASLMDQRTPSTPMGA